MMRGTHGVIASSLSSGGIPSDYIARYVFNGDVTDESGSYDATNNSGTFVSAGDGPGGTDYGISLGSGAHVALPTSLLTALGSGAGTLSCVVRPTTTTGSTRIFYSADTAINTGFLGFRLSPTDNYPDCTFNSSNAYQAQTSVSAGAWHHLVLRTDGSNTTYRLDGTNLSTTVTAGSDTGAWLGDVTSADNFLVGRLVRTTTSESEDFDIALMTWFDRSLSDAECLELEGEY